MSAIFVDTSGWGNLFDANQPFHAQAASVYQEAARQRQGLVTTNYVVAELVALLHSPLRVPRPTVIGILDYPYATPHVSVIHIDASLN